MAKKTGTYIELLKDPRWQKIRLSVFERDNWSCVKCGRNDITLHVHHFKYTGEPWCAPLKDLSTVCENCHRNEHKIILIEQPFPVGYNYPLKWRNNPDIVSINKQITSLNNQLKNPTSDEATTEILTTIIKLQKKRKEMESV